ncbi:MAG: NAD-dependent protein deacetylase [Pseudomonadales bacterium]|nr:NAD-dependent protein deacetylase [Pseudomonadales bacterium]
MENTTSVSFADSDIGSLTDFFEKNKQVFVITGAGISQASGIPTYRDDNGTWKSNVPIQNADFINSESTRQHYWARSFVGWPAVSNAIPNTAHHALVDLETQGFIRTLVTQNIDRLHQKAGHKNSYDLHGRLDQVICLDCGAIVMRDDIQSWLAQYNPHLTEVEKSKVLLNPDGDAEVKGGLIGATKIPHCEKCDGMLKPNVVFYGGFIDKPFVDELYKELFDASAVLVVGSSLTVYSSFRFCKIADQRGMPIGCINQGVTRCDDLFSLKIESECGQVLSETCQLLQN